MPLSHPAAARAEILCGQNRGALAKRRIRLPLKSTSGCGWLSLTEPPRRSYREMVVEGPVPEDPWLLLVKSRLVLARGWGHSVFRCESLANTPFSHASRVRIQAVAGPRRRRGLSRVVRVGRGHAGGSLCPGLRRVLALVSAPSSINYMVLPGIKRDALLEVQPHAAESVVSDATRWWQVVGLGVRARPTESGPREE